MYISFVDEYVVQFNTEDFHCGSLHKEEIWKVLYRIWNIVFGVSFPSQSRVSLELEEVISNMYLDIY
jgi:hypothetical protein